MITSLFIYIISYLLLTIYSISNFIARGWSVWPDNLIDGLTYFLTSLMNWDFLMNITQMLLALKFLFAFEVVYLSVKLLMRLFNYFRGSGGLEV